MLDNWWWLVGELLLNQTELSLQSSAKKKSEHFESPYIKITF